MRLFGNILWFILAGWWLALTWLLGAVVFAITIIGIPLTRSAVEMAKMAAFPFGKDIVHVREIDQRDDPATMLTGTVGFIFNVLWLITFGLALFVGYLVAGVLACLTLILIPFGIQAFKLAAISVWPVGRRVVSTEMATAIRQRNASAQLGGG